MNKNNGGERRQRSGKLCVTALIAGLWLGSAATSYAANPTEGAKLYNRYCVNCHGVSGSGDMPGTPNFSRGEGLFQADSALAGTIRLGKNVMPGFQGILTRQEIFDVISYLRTLQ